MKIHLIIFIIIITGLGGYAQSYPPAAGFQGSTAIHKDSSIITGWAVSAEINRGLLNISDSESDTVSFGTTDNVIGYADGNPGVVSLGDGGSIIIQLEKPIRNISGPDFAVFENGFRQGGSGYNAFLELAFVEVSSDGVNFYRFPAISEIQTEIQISSFAETDARYIHNLAGKYIADFGTPFELEDLKNQVNSNFSIENITHIKIIDVIGTINNEFASYDSNGNIINDPYPTPFPSGGFDLDAVAFLNQNANVIIISELIIENPVTENIIFPYGIPESGILKIYNLQGKLIMQEIINSQNSIFSANSLQKGFYLLVLEGEINNYLSKILKI